MKNLNSILRRAADRRLKAGGAVSGELIDDLRRYRKELRIGFIAMEVVVVAGVALCAYYIIAHPEELHQAKLLAGIFGIGAGGAVEAMRRIWKEWSQTALTLILLSEASEAQVTFLIDKMIKRL